MSGWYELGNSSDGQFRFVLKAGNAETILSSEIYKSLDSAENGVASVQKNSPDDSRYERKESSNGKFYFTLKAANHQVIGASQMYSSASSRDDGIESVKKNGPSTTVKRAQLLVQGENHRSGRDNATGSLHRLAHCGIFPIAQAGC